MPYWRMKQGRLFREPGCSIERPLIHQSKSKGAAGIGCEWLSREETCVYVWVCPVPVTITTGADEGGYENLAGGQEAKCRWVKFFK
jgi:hypothetical protein